MGQQEDAIIKAIGLQDVVINKVTFSESELKMETCEAVARLLRSNPKTMWDLDQWRMRAMKSRMALPKDIDLSHMSTDEVHFRTMPRRTL